MLVLGIDSGRMKLPLIASLVASLTLCVAGATPAQATYPGSNGNIAYASDMDGDYEIYVVPPGGGLSVKLTNNAVDDRRPAYSADGKLIFWDQKLASDKHVIMVMRANGSGQNKLTSSTKDSWGPAPGPNGTIAFVRTVTGNSEIFTMDTDGTNVDQLTDTGRYADEPAWSPNGKTLAFTRSYQHYSAIFTMTAAGKNKTAITPPDADYYDPSWSPDGTRIAVDSDLTTNSDIYTMTKTGTGLVQITSSAGVSILPQYSPDGTKISYSTDDSGFMEVVTAPVGGGTETPITSNSATSNNGSWRAV